MWAFASSEQPRGSLVPTFPNGFHCIRHYGLFANANRAENVATARALLNVARPAADPQEQPDIAADTPHMLAHAHAAPLG